ncbi:zinc finger C2HC domain-containing protein 1A [Gouania willdenowi]|uniref:zinc finger C2HC domain-containing protein 1A n=1 Tax=Gouania willdenowi TaxID=441366 RepID=UPI00105564ED|nr:zinc finger C2HC domain-containing protein 1A [Gouania willdenowi]
MMEEFEDGAAPPSVDLVQCNFCERSFFPKVLEKHTKICQKSAAKRRKVFDSSRQRAEGTEISVLKPIKAKAEPPKKQSNWRKKHEDFISTIRAAKMVTVAMKEGGPLPPPPPPTYDPDYIQCPYCQRRFSESAADRHIKFCKEQHARMPNKGKPGEAKKPAGSTPLKPPAAVKKTNAPVVSSIPSASSRLPQRSGFGQQSGIPSTKASSAGSVRSAGLTSPPSGAANKPQVMSSGYGSARKTNPGTGLIKKKAEANISRNNGNVVNDVSKFCHSCGTRYPVESAKFCCECGMRRMCM